jgi:hypothetical protein
VWWPSAAGRWRDVWGRHVRCHLPSLTRSGLGYVTPISMTTRWRDEQFEVITSRFGERHIQLDSARTHREVLQGDGRDEVSFRGQPLKAGTVHHVKAVTGTSAGHSFVWPGEDHVARGGVEPPTIRFSVTHIFADQGTDTDRRATQRATSCPY